MLLFLETTWLGKDPVEYEFLLQLIKFMLLAIMGFSIWWGFFSFLQPQLRVTNRSLQRKNREQSLENTHKLQVDVCCYLQQDFPSRISYLLVSCVSLRKVHEIRIFIPRYSEKPEVAAIPTFFAVSDWNMFQMIWSNNPEQPSQHPQIAVLEFCCNTVFLCFFSTTRVFCFPFIPFTLKNPIVCQAARAAMAPGVAGSWCKGVEP